MMEFLYGIFVGFILFTIIFGSIMRNKWVEAKNSWIDALELIQDFAGRIEKLKQENK